MIRPGELDCGYDCHTDERYGFVPEADCPVHDKPGVKETMDASRESENTHGHQKFTICKLCGRVKR